MDLAIHRIITIIANLINHLKFDSMAVTNLAHFFANILCEKKKNLIKSNYTVTQLYWLLVIF